ncbi:enoyl-CoA hydratase-related protein [uncultured Albimonas sp.]|uniref:enoyl-CoA hydratase/isomerase family protein n=1 Tax=uncultured Albimonas sp. TaxID=1331701 RepID=UPI0030EED97D|tara:strand:- start:18618 stop:19412 length:795 start_codon:yes stop_codon:yes gene_type:complete
MDFETYETLKFARRGRVLAIALSAPQARNAVSRLMHQELIRALEEADLDEDSDVLVLTGEGDAFCGGGDIAWMKAMREKPAERKAAISEGRRILYTILELDKPIIGKVRGPAIGLGATLALFCDVIFASETAKFADPHVRVGLVAGDGGAVIWPALLGPARAKEYLMTGDVVTGRKAMELGLVNHCLPDAELDAAVDAFADRLAGGALAAIRWTKRAVNAGLRAQAAPVLELAFAYEAASMETDDHRAAVDAFLAGHAPTFQGR